MVFQEDMTTGGGGHGDKKEDQGEDNEIPLHELPIDSESKLSSFFSTKKPGFPKFGIFVHFPCFSLFCILRFFNS